jgi:hypothetical protein
VLLAIRDELRSVVARADERREAGLLVRIAIEREITATGVTFAISSVATPTQLFRCER